MRQIASIEVYIIVSELQGIVGSYLKKFYDIGNGAYRLLFSSSHGNKIVYVKLTQAINLTDIVEEVDEPTNFAKAIRKRLLGKKVKAISQRYSDRIIIFEFEGEEEYKLIVEMFGKGNMVLTSKDYLIEVASNILKQRERTIAPKQIYQFPPSIKIDLSEITSAQVDGILEKVTQSTDRVIKELSKSLDIGPTYLEDILLRSGIDPKSKGTELRAQKTVKESILHFFKELKNPKPQIYERQGSFVDYSIVPLSKYSDCTPILQESMSKALEQFYLHERTKIDKSDEHLQELEANIRKQKQIIQELELSEKQDAQAGHKIMSHMAMLNQIISYVNEKRRVSEQELAEKFNVKVKSLDLKNKSIVIELD